ncbi:MAG: pilus assembly protein PilP [Algiphilus sp.]
MKRRAASPVLRLTVGALVALSLAACDDGRDDLRSYIERIKARPAQPLEPLPEPKTYEPYTYREAGRRNPFIPIEPELSAGSRNDDLRPDQNRLREPLEAFPLDALRMVGVVTKGGVRYALIRDPEGVIHRVPAGAYAGQNYGRVTAITSTEVQLIEIVPDGFGGWTERPATIPLAE